MNHLDELKEQDRVWKERRMVSGHGAQDGSARDPDYKALIVFIGGPIKHWWDENWMSPEHLRYDEWRTKTEEACIAASFLVYKPYTAWKGTWNEEAQAVNDTVIGVIDVFIDLTPPGVPSKGTTEERKLAKDLGVEIFNFPPSLYPNLDENWMNHLITFLKTKADQKNGALIYG